MGKLYTKTGDTGTTGLAGGARVAKSDPRITCIGDVDELNAAIGLCATIASEPSPLHKIQNELFNIGAALASTTGGAETLQLPLSAIARLESEIDSADALLPPLRNFILPGGCELAARLHLARTVCRRAERHAVSLSTSSEKISPAILVYLNRLSDWLFVHARLANQEAGVPDVLWTK
ncbi:MAG TPA: cob(I)yrinic acid a,c-diamide adenosyltransferase [Tepidisphaeraceae bacterium]|nr:cob(I)yrinic acid a,c-diamide adenosyltransferase [Tepidisphaeraceae bacterium]